MMPPMPALVDQFCPNVHDAPITAAAYDPESGTIATADQNGVVAVQRPGEATPQLIFQPGVAVMGALGIIRGGSLVAVGDDDGSIGVFRTDNGEAVFQEVREGARGRVRAFRGVAVSPEGARVAAISVDGLLRVWELTRDERNAWRGFSGDTVVFDPRGQRLLAMDEDGQPRLMDLMTLQALYMDRLQTPAERARFTWDGTMVLAVGPAGISLLRVADGALVASFATRGGSGISNLIISPDGSQAGAVTQRSVHTFSLPDLQPVDSVKHGAVEPTGAAYWSTAGIRVAGNDGLMHSGGSGGAGPVTSVGGFAEHRIAAHVDRISYWRNNRREQIFPCQGTIREVQVDRDGRLVVAIPHAGPIQVYDCQTGRSVFDGGPETSGALEVGVGGTVVATQLRAGGCRWWDLAANKGFELRWPTTMALSNGGTWLGVVTPKGAVRILDPATGKDAVQPPVPLADNVPVKLMAFVNRRPDLLILDAEGVLGHYDLAQAIREGKPGQGRDVITVNVPADRIWGITGGQFCAMRLPQEDSCSIIWVDIHACDVVGEATGLSRWAWVDAENGLILEPGRASAIIERERDGSERRILRSLPDDEWIGFGWRGILDCSPGAASRV
jgi:WD40 repeat protein